MKWGIRIFLIVALAVAVGIFARTHWGYVQIATPSFSLETTLNFFITALAAIFIVFYALLRAVQKLWNLPQRWRQTRK
ncbi:MAG: hypothetical protein LBB65_04775 [Burkholderiales bacterium]|jgi:HemY protein|nr:hypothetical protein [Burkholderiales bacterium]